MSFYKFNEDVYLVYGAKMRKIIAYTTLEEAICIASAKMFRI